MVYTKEMKMPSDEELTVPEVNISTSGLRAGSFHLGKYCEHQNNEFMLCRNEEKDPRKCLAEGRAVTGCSLEFFQKVKKSCATEFTQYANCLDRSSSDFDLSKCRKTQAEFDNCALENLNIERPYFGYFSEVKIHHTERPRPPGIEKPTDFPDRPNALPDDEPRAPAKFGNRKYFFN